MTPQCNNKIDQSMTGGNQTSVKKPSRLPENDENRNMVGSTQNFTRNLGSRLLPLFFVLFLLAVISPSGSLCRRYWSLRELIEHGVAPCFPTLCFLLFLTLSHIPESPLVSALPANSVTTDAFSAGPILPTRRYLVHFSLH